MGLHHSPRIVTDGLVLCLDAADKNSYPGSGNTWYDLSGNGNNGTLQNTPSFDNYAKGVLSFDGSNDYVNIPYNTSLDFDYITLEYFVKPGEKTHVRPFVNRATTGINQVHPWRLLMSNPSASTFNFQIYINGTIQTTLSTTLFELDKFYHVTTTFNGTKLIMYINGIIEDSITVSGVIDKTTSNIEVGRNVFYNPERYANQDAAVLKLYNRALTATEIQQNYNATKTRFGL